MKSDSITHTDEYELSRIQHRAGIAVEVIRYLQPGPNRAEWTMDREEKDLYRAAIRELTGYLGGPPEPEDYEEPRNG